MSHFASYPSLRDRVVFISGGGSGIGAAIVEHFAEQGSKTAFVDIDDAASTALVQKISAAGHPAPLYSKCDVRDVKAYQAVIAEIGGSLGAITVLVNNAARDDRHSLEEVTPAYWDERIAVNLRHQFFGARGQSAIAAGRREEIERIAAMNLQGKPDVFNHAEILE